MIAILGCYYIHENKCNDGIIKPATLYLPVIKHNGTKWREIVHKKNVLLTFECKKLYAQVFM